MLSAEYFNNNFPVHHSNLVKFEKIKPEYPIYYYYIYDNWNWRKSFCKAKKGVPHLSLAVYEVFECWFFDIKDNQLNVSLAV